MPTANKAILAAGGLLAGWAATRFLDQMLTSKQEAEPEEQPAEVPMSERRPPQHSPQRRRR